MESNRGIKHIKELIEEIDWCTNLLKRDVKDIKKEMEKRSEIDRDNQSYYSDSMKIERRKRRED